MPEKSISQEVSFSALDDNAQVQFDLMAEALDASQDGFAIWKAVRSERNEILDFTLVFINKAGANATGRTPAQLTGLTLKEVVGEEACDGLLELFSNVLIQGETIKEVVPVHSPAGWSGNYENTAVPLSKDQVLTTYRDVSEEQREHGRLVWLTEHDYLTGMPNRSKLESYLEACLNDAKENGHLTAFVFIDIDYFKTVNDTYGHDIGDALLVNFAKRVRHSLPESVLLARIAGDEFSIVIEDVQSREHLDDLLREVFNSMQRPFNHNTPDLKITCSAGAVLTDGSEKVEEVMRFADKAMYQAKYDGRNRYLIDVRLGS